MPKSKYAPALFEVINRTEQAKKEGGLSLPKWWKGRSGAGSTTEKGTDASGVSEAETPAATPPAAESAGPTAASSASPPAAAPVSSEPAATGPAPAPAPAPASAPAAAEKPVRVIPAAPRPKAPVTADDGEPPPLFRLGEGRLELSLNAVNACVAGGVLLLALFVSYELGKFRGAPSPAAVERTETADTQDELAEILAEPPQREVLGARGGARAPTAPDRGGAARPAPVTETPAPRPEQPAAPRAPAAGEETAWPTVGLNYVILARYAREDVEEARHAQAWLAGRNVATRLRESGNHHLLMTAEGFDYGNRVEQERCLRLRDHIIALGREYRDEFRGQRVIRYTFHDPEIRRWR